MDEVPERILISIIHIFQEAHAILNMTELFNRTSYYNLT